MIVVEINNKRFKVKDINNISIDAYTKMSKELASCNSFDCMSRIVLRYLTDIPNWLIDILDSNSLTNLDISKMIVVGNLDLDISYNDITLGQFIDVENSLHHDDTQLASALLTQPIGTSLDKLRTIKFTAAEAMSILNKYFEWRMAVFSTYDDVVTKSSRIDETPKNAAEIWLSLAYRLTDNITEIDDILNKKFTEVLFWLRMKKNENTERSN